ncbi:solute carrier family 35 member F2-like isoform X1 [Dysidea avara]|uniref:solute carrier family 35 member F2-like isoform X1 n=1 Tax=Dysidea avara TaxID=196820 RepID=UPI0033329360
MECFSKWRLVLLTLIFGQMLAFLMCGTGVFTQLLQINYDVENISTFQTFPNYILLFLTFGGSLACRGDIDRVIREHWWKYILVTILDLETNYLYVVAYQYTTIASAQAIINGVTILATVMLSLLFLKVQYKIVHYIGSLISIVGIVLLFLADSEGNNSSQGRNEVLGDALCVIGGLTNAIVFVIMEYMIKASSIREYLGMVGIVGVCLSSTQVCVLERRSVAEIQWSWPVALSFAGYIACLYLVYILCAVLLQIASAVICNLCILCANVYNLVFGILLFSNIFSGFYLAAFAFLLLGLVVYNTRVAPSADKDQSPFTLIYWQSYCNSLWCEWRCVCRKSDPELAPLLNGTGSGVNSERTEELRSPQPSVSDDTNLDDKKTIPVM